MKISVIICAYNYARFLPQCLESVLAQSRQADEIIVVDDGSTDETSQVIRNFPQIRYLRQENAGKAAAFNRGFQESQGDIICHLDADDYWLPEKLAFVADSLARTDAGGVLHDAIYVDGQGRMLYGSEAVLSNAVARRHISFRELLLMCFVYRPLNVSADKLGVVNTICVRRHAIADCLPLPEDLGLAVDGALLLSAARRGLLCFADKLSAYRHHGANSYVASPGSLAFQIRLFRWAERMPSVTAARDKRLLQALAMEIAAYSGLRGTKDRARRAYDAAILLPKLVGVGLIPHWKHLGLPFASLIGWPNVRRALRSAATS
jgi:Glycosyl transferase family 2